MLGLLKFIRKMELRREARIFFGDEPPPQITTPIPAAPETPIKITKKKPGRKRRVPPLKHRAGYRQRRRTAHKTAVREG